MAGNYADVPAHRLAYDRDGSVGVGITSAGTITALTATQLQGFNSESEATVAPSTSAFHVALIFPIPIDIAAFFLALETTAAVSIWTSKNTTTGADGTWTQRVAATSYFRDVKPQYRIGTNLTAIPGGIESVGVRGIKVTGVANLPNFRAFHVYGDPSSTATPDRLSVWHPTLNEPLPATYLDWGDVPRSSSADRNFRIKNLSASLTANDVEVYTEALTPGTPSVPSMHSISDNGGSTFLTSISIPSLDPGEISDVLVLRRVIPSNALVSVWSARLGVDVGAWTS